MASSGTNSSKVLRAQCKAASVLMRATPPYRSSMAVKQLVRLRGGAPSDEPAFISHLLTTANRTHSAVNCRRSGCGRSFLATEYNRDGDAHRCPWCNAYTTAAGTSFPRPANLLNKALRKLEKRLTEKFDEYSRLYYGEHAVTNCFVWSNDGGVSDLGVAVLIVNECDAAAISAATKIPSMSATGGTWNSTHVFSIVHDERLDATMYRGATTVYVDIGAGPCRYSGFIEKRYPPTSDRYVEDLYAHVVGVGERVQRMENSLRDEVAGVQFGKAAQILSALRLSASRAGGSYEGKDPNAAGRRAADDPLSRKAQAAQPQQHARAAPAMPPPPPMPKSSSSDAVSASGRVRADGPPPPPPPPPMAQPAAVVVVETLPVQEEGEVEEAAGEEEEEEEEGQWTLEDVVASLELEEDTAELLALLAAGDVNTVEDLVQCDESYLKHSCGLPREARKALAEWISWQFEEAGGEE